MCRRLKRVERCAVYEEVYEEDKLSKSNREILLPRRTSRVVKVAEIPASRGGKTEVPYSDMRQGVKSARQPPKGMGAQRVLCTRYSRGP